MHSSPGSTPSRGSPFGRPKSSRFGTPSPAQSSSDPSSSEHTAKPVATFYSCLSIPVEGSKPIDPEPAVDSQSAHPDQASSSDGQRAPRKSKTEALAALNSHNKSSSVDADDPGHNDILAEKYRNTAPIPVSPIFNLSTVKTSSPAGYSPSPHPPRPFGLQDCPEFFPTMEEFKDPMAYVRTISKKAKEHGICKVIPPEGWKMPFVTDSEV